MSVRLTLGVVVMLLMLNVACTGSRERARQEFIKEWLTSVQQDSPMFRQFVDRSRDVDLIRTTIRPRLGLHHEVRLVDSYGDGSYDYVVTSKGSRFSLTLKENNGKAYD